jgi:hypothetical protein
MRLVRGDQQRGRRLIIIGRCGAVLGRRGTLVGGGLVRAGRRRHRLG